MNGVGLLEGDEMIPLLTDWLTECSLPFGFGLRRDDKCAIVVHRYQLETIADIAIYIHEISLYAVCSYPLHRLWQTLDCGVSGISASSSQPASQPASFSIGVYFNFDFFVQLFVLIFVGSDGSVVCFVRSCQWLFKSFNHHEKRTFFNRFYEVFFAEILSYFFCSILFSIKLHMWWKTWINCMISNNLRL